MAIFRCFLTNITSGYIDVNAENEEEAKESLQYTNFNDEFVIITNEFILNYTTMLQ